MTPMHASEAAGIALSLRAGRAFYSKLSRGKGVGMGHAWHCMGAQMTRTCAWPCWHGEVVGWGRCCLDLQSVSAPAK